MCICSTCCLQFRLEKSEIFFCLESGNPEYCKSGIITVTIVVIVTVIAIFIINSYQRGPSSTPLLILIVRASRLILGQAREFEGVLYNL